MRPALFAIITAVCIALPSVAAEPYENPNDVHPPLVGTTIPATSAETAAGETVTLQDLTKGKPTVLVFYRGGWCPFCNRQLAALAVAHKDLAALGYQILAVSPDTPDKLAATASKNGVDYTLLSDADAELMSAFGIAFKHRDRVLPVPAVFIIDGSGVIQFHYVNPNYKTRLSTSLLMAAAQAALPAE